MELVYIKKYIKTADDLPKEDSWYYVAKKNTLKTSGLKPMIYTVVSKNRWLKEVGWYLLPVPADEIRRQLLNRFGFIDGGVDAENQLKIFSFMEWLQNLNR